MKIKVRYTAGLIVALSILPIIGFIISPPARAQNISVYTLAESERVVTSYEELKDALASDNGVTTVYFGANITMKATGITINPKKADIVVSGINPLDPDQTASYTLTDYNSDTWGYTIYVDSGNSTLKTLRIRDLTIIGKNWYGPFSVYDSSNTAGLVVTYERVNYTGPQFGYHRRGKLHIIDCSFTINSTYSAGEFAEAHDFEFEGKNVIHFQTSTWAVFWHTNTSTSDHGTFRIADDSSLTVTANTRDSATTAYGLFAASRGYIDITVGENAAFNIETNSSINGLASGSAAYITSMTVQSGGAFNLGTTAAAMNVVMQMNGALSIADDASFIINGYRGAGFNLFAQREGDITVGTGATFQLVTANVYSALLTLYGCSLICNDPASVLFYNPAGRVIQSVDTPGSISVSAEQLNYWTAAGTGGFDDAPRYHWKKTDGSNFIVNGTIAVGTSGNFSSLTSNYMEGDSPGTAPDSDALSMVSARVLSFGRLELIIYELNEQSTAISGTTTPAAAVRASFGQDGADAVLPDSTADGDGLYTIPIVTPLAVDTMVIVRGNYQYLTAAASAMVSPVGKIEMTVPDNLVFDTTALAPGVQTARRTNTDWGVTVTDTRGTGKGWRLYVRATVPLTRFDTPGSAVDNALVFVDDTEAVIALDATEELLIYRRTATADSDTTVVQWDPDHGILARIPPGAISTGSYVGTLEWILADTP